MGVPMASNLLKHGYPLTVWARRPEAISMAEIIAALEGPIALTECISVEGDCSHEALCPVRSNWRRINQAVRSALSGISLAEMAHPRQHLVTLGHGGLQGGHLPNGQLGTAQLAEAETQVQGTFR